MLRKNMTLTESTPEEQAVIDELKRRTVDCVTPKMLEDNYLFYRFAKARDYNIDEAESMLRKNVVWRKENEIDTITTEYKPPKSLVKYVPTVQLCFDKEGCPVRHVDGGRVDCKGLWNCATKQDLMKYYSYRIEQNVEAMKKRNGKLQKHILTVIFDFEKLTCATATNMKTLQYCLYFLKTYLDNFPETLKIAMVINAPFYFVWAFTVFKTVLPPSVIKKIQIYGTDGWKEPLLELINADDLPVYLGGNRTDPDGNPLCHMTVKFGIPIPKSCYMTSEKKKLGPEFDKLSILPFSKEEINFEVKEANSDLEWEYEVKNRDIDFSLHFIGEDLVSEELIPKQRIDTFYETEKGLFKCERVGKYTLVLDNTYSWIHPKEVYLRVAIKSPTEDTSEQCL